MPSKSIETHAIQLVDVYPMRLYIEAVDLPKRNIGVEIEDTSIKIGASEIVEEGTTAAIYVSVLDYLVFY